MPEYVVVRGKIGRDGEKFHIGDTIEMDEGEAGHLGDRVILKAHYHPPEKVAVTPTQEAAQSGRSFPAAVPINREPAPESSPEPEPEPTKQVPLKNEKGQFVKKEGKKGE